MERMFDGWSLRRPRAVAPTFSFFLYFISSCPVAFCALAGCFTPPVAPPWLLRPGRLHGLWPPLRPPTFFTCLSLCYSCYSPAVLLFVVWQHGGNYYPFLFALWAGVGVFYTLGGFSDFSLPGWVDNSLPLLSYSYSRLVYKLVGGWGVGC